MLAAVLKQKGHDVLVVDYQFKHSAPPPGEFVKAFNPDVIGVTLYTATMTEANRVIDAVSKLGIPIMVGGPHATLYHEELASDSRLDYIVVGEAEEVIAGIVEGAVRQTKPQVIKSTPPDPRNLPFPDFAFHGREDISIYPLLTSRGCPHVCSFCAVHLVSTRKWRPRDPKECVYELTKAKKELPKLSLVTVYDDNPTMRKEHIKEFLNLYLGEGISLPLTIINTRADGLDDEILGLLKKAGCPSIGLGVESGCPTVFEKIKKGETLEEIGQVAKLVKKHGMSLALCFVIGLEGDSLEGTKQSIKFAKEINPDHIYWNMITPFKGTRIREWYDENGKVFDVVGHSSYVDADFVCDEPCAESPQFSVEDRKKAYMMAVLETRDNKLRLRHIPRLIPYVREYKLCSQFLRWLPNQVMKDWVAVFSLNHEVVRVCREYGLISLGKKAVRMIAPKNDLGKGLSQGER
jgi:radical SAM superfamily enzyme YgiQ (UPF0313 family)